MPDKSIEPARIGEGVGYFVFGIASLVIGFFFSIGGLALGPTASFFTALGAILILAGFWTRLFNHIERRLMEIQTAVLNPQDPRAM